MQSINRPRHRAATPLPVLTKSQRELMEELMNSVSPPLPVAESQRPLKRNFSNDLQQGSQFCSPQDYSSQDSWVANQNQVQCAQAVGSQDASVPATETPTGSPVSKVSCTPGMEIPEGSPVVNGGATGDPLIAKKFERYCAKYRRAMLLEETFTYDLAPKIASLVVGIEEAQERYQEQEGAVIEKGMLDTNEVLRAKEQRMRDHKMWLRTFEEQTTSQERAHQWWLNYWAYRGGAQEINYQAWFSYWTNQLFDPQVWIADCRYRMDEQMRAHQSWLINREYQRVEEERKYQEWMDKYEEIERELASIINHNIHALQSQFNQAVDEGNSELRLLRGKLRVLQEDWARYKQGMDSLYRHVAEQDALEAHLMKAHTKMCMPTVGFKCFICPCQ